MTDLIAAGPDAAEELPGTRTRLAAYLQLGRLIGVRLIIAALTVIGAMSVVYIMLLMTGSPAELMAPDDATRAQVALIAHEYGFDRAIPAQYVSFLLNLFRGRLPRSLLTGQPAFAVVWARVPNTLLLSGTGTALGICIGLLVGYISATSRIRAVRRVSIGALMATQAVPSFFLGLLAILVIALWWGVLPTSGSGSASHLVLPAVTLSLYVAPAVARLFRTSIVEAAHADHVLTAIAKGISERRVRIRHVAINALVPTTSLIGLQVGSIIGGTVVIESVFNWPGVGQELVSSVNGRDYPVAIAAVLLIVVGFVLVNMITDVVVRMLDPRISSSAGWDR